MTSRQNLGEIRLGNNVQAGQLLQDVPGLTDNHVRLFQLRGIIHELFHTLDFGDVVQLTGGDHDAAIQLQGLHISFFRNPAGYARNEIQTDARAALVLERNGLIFPELRQHLDQYRVYWEAQQPLSEAAFAAVCASLNRTQYP